MSRGTARIVLGDIELRQVRDFPNYYAGSDGYVYSRFRDRWRKLTGQHNAQGYYHVRLYSADSQKTRTVHRIIATAFHGERPEGMQCCHNNGDKYDNRPQNLRWDTPRANAADRIKHETVYRPNGHLNVHAKLSESEVEQIRRSPLRDVDVAEKFGVCRKTVWNIRNNRTWRLA